MTYRKPDWCGEWLLLQLDESTVHMYRIRDQLTLVCRVDEEGYAKVDTPELLPPYIVTKLQRMLIVEPIPQGDFTHDRQN